LALHNKEVDLKFNFDEHMNKTNLDRREKSLWTETQEIFRRHQNTVSPVFCKPTFKAPQKPSKPPKKGPHGKGA